MMTAQTLRRVMFVRPKRSRRQATRTEPAIERTVWMCKVLPGSTNPWAMVETLDDARELAARMGFVDGVSLWDGISL